MRIGLLTYHNSTNYGAVMQCYATCRALQELGHEVEIINFCQDEKKSSRSFVFYFKLKYFRQFMDKYYPKLTEPISDIKLLKRRKWDFDYLLVGSDQVWNPQIAKDKLEAYFLNFGNGNINRVSYSSSFGISEWPRDKVELVPIIKKYLSCFKSLSVREHTGKKMLASLFGQDAQVVLDPTLLHLEYSELIGLPPSNHQIICYLLNRTKAQLEVTKELAKKMGKKPRMISTIHYTKGFSYTYPPSIENWLKYICGADFVVTDSFHGLAFSLIFNKQFVVISPNNGKNSRLIDLMELLGLENRYLVDSEVSSIDRVLNEKINYNVINSVLDNLREKSWEYLKNALR